MAPPGVGHCRGEGPDSSPRPVSPQALVVVGGDAPTPTRHTRLRGVRPRLNMITRRDPLVSGVSTDELLWWNAGVPKARNLRAGPRRPERRVVEGPDFKSTTGSKSEGPPVREKIQTVQKPAGVEERQPLDSRDKRHRPRPTSVEDLRRASGTVYTAPRKVSSDTVGGASGRPNQGHYWTTPVRVGRGGRETH